MTKSVSACVLGSLLAVGCAAPQAAIQGPTAAPPTTSAPVPAPAPVVPVIPRGADGKPSWHISFAKLGSPHLVVADRAGRYLTWFPSTLAPALTWGLRWQKLLMQKQTAC